MRAFWQATANEKTSAWGGQGAFVSGNVHVENSLPRIAELREQYAKQDATKKSLWSQYHEIRNSDKEIDNAWANVKAILNLKDELEIEAPEINLPQIEKPELIIPENKKEPQIPEASKRNRKRNDPSL